MEPVQSGQVNRSAAEIYEEFFIPALFHAWPDQVAEAAHLQPGARVLDVATGTGVLARAALGHVRPEGTVVGLDVNEGMLAVAARIAPQVDWRLGQAEALPFEDASFDAVVSQFGLMFFADQVVALREMFRVLRPGGWLAVAVWDSLDHTPGYAAMVHLLHRLFGEEAAEGLRAPYNLGDVARLRALFEAASIPGVTIATRPGQARFPSLEAWMFTDIKGWVLADLIDDAQFARLLAEAQTALAPFVTAAGDVAFSAPAHIASARKP